MAATISQLPSSIDWLAQADDVAQCISRRAAEHDAKDAFVSDNFALMKERGFFKAHVPSELGGHGAHYATICAVVRRLVAACGSTGLAYSMHRHARNLSTRGSCNPSVKWTPHLRPRKSLPLT